MTARGYDGYLRIGRANRWRGLVPASEEARAEARKDWVRRTPPKDSDGVSLYTVGDDDAEHRLIAAAVVADRSLKDGVLDDDNVDLLPVTDQDFDGLGVPSHTPYDSCLARVGERHYSLDWRQQELDALADRLANAGRKARRFSRVDLRETLLRLLREDVICDEVWTCLEKKRNEWREYVERERKKENDRARSRP